MIALLLAAVVAGASPDGHASSASGALLYTQNCASCHGAQHHGSADGPSLHGAGLSSVDFYLRTGRMPAAAAWLEVEHRDARAGQRLSDAQIDALEAYLAPIVAGGPPIPVVAAGGNLAHGHRLYELNCEQCHAVGGYGGSLGKSDWAPALDRATVQDVGNAIRTGPGEMPRFGVNQLSARDVNDLAAYVVSMRTANRETGQLPLHSTGPVPEGAIGYVAIVGLIVFVFFFWRNDTPPKEREEAVRRDET